MLEHRCAGDSVLNSYCSWASKLTELPSGQSEKGNPIDYMIPVFDEEMLSCSEDAELFSEPKTKRIFLCGASSTKKRLS